MKFSILTAAAAALSLSAGAAHAAALTWTLEASFDDGSTASGTYDFDADTGVFSNISISNSIGDTFLFADGDYFFFPDPAEDFQFLSEAPAVIDQTRTFLISLVSPMTNAGGVIDIDPSRFLGLGTGDSFIGTCGVLSTAECDSVSGPFSDVVSGTVSSVTAPVPVPAAAILFAPALVGLARRRRKQQG